MGSLNGIVLSRPGHRESVTVRRRREGARGYQLFRKWNSSSGSGAKMGKMVWKPGPAQAGQRIKVVGGYSPPQRPAQPDCDVVAVAAPSCLEEALIGDKRGATR